MCGIAAIVRRPGAIDPAEIDSLTRSVAHRGPDGLVCRVFNGQVALGHSRLAIQDLSRAADQPMVSVCGRYVIIFNGEIYNFLEIRRRLQQRGIVFHTKSDTEVVLQAWIEKGIACLHEFNGMWAFLIWDLIAGEGYLTRDRFGVKPVYYATEADQVSICSEIDALARWTGLYKSENDHFLRSIVAGDTRVYGTAETHVREVSSLPAGHVARIHLDGTVEVSRWYTLRRLEVPRKLTDQAALMRQMLSDACSLRLRSDVPVATCLSGGIDSSAIVSTLQLLRRQGRDSGAFTYRSFTAAFPGTELDETRLASVIAEINQVSLDAYIVECPTPEQLEVALGYCDGPMPSLSFYPIWKLYQHIRESGTVVTLDGQGADEMLGGYFIGAEALISGWQSRNMLRVYDLAQTYAALHADGAEWMRAAKAAMLRYAAGEIDQACKKPLKSIAESLGLYCRRPSRMPKPMELPDAVPAESPERGDWLAHKLWDQFFADPLPFLLHQYDRCSMASGVECRMPFLDYRLVEFIFSLPLSSRVGGGVTKRILRKAMEGLVPEEVLKNRRKIGFNAPLRHWLSGPLRGWIMDIAASKVFLDNPYFNGKEMYCAIEKELRTANPQLCLGNMWPCVHLSWWQMQNKKMRLRYGEIL